MKKPNPLLLVLCMLLVCGLLAGCGAKEPEDNALALYSFHGGDDRFSLTSGIIAITDQETIIYGGDLENTGEAFQDISSFSLRLYVLKDGAEVPLIDVEHIFKDAERDAPWDNLVSGSFASARIDGSLIEQEYLKDNLYFEVLITHSNQEQTKHTIHLSVVNVTDPLVNVQA